MFIAMIIVFVLGYTLIALEHPIRINKTATALKLGVIMWVMLILGGIDVLVDTSDLKHYMEEVVGGSFTGWVVHHELLHHLGEISEILFFLLGAMTIVELVDSFEGFRIITDKISTTKRSKLLWILSILTFFMSAALDNLTTSIVMVALLRKLIADRKDRWFFAGMVILAANAGGAWSPIGDVTTIMLWIAGKVTTVNIIIMTIIPSLVAMIVPLAILSFTMKGNVARPERPEEENKHQIPTWESRLLFFMGVGGLLFVPVFKNLTHLPPCLGMLFSLGVLWTTTEILQARRHADIRYSAKHLTIVGVLRKVDVPSVLFFLGILLAVAALSTSGHLDLMAVVLGENIGNLYIINIIIGVLSAIVDNVPLVAGAMGMYNFPTDHYFWMFLAYCAGTGGSILIIGSAAGVAVMGMEKIDFIWYLRKISLLALIGYLAGAGTYILQNESRILHKKEVPSAYVVDINDDDAVMHYLIYNEFVKSTGEHAEEGLHHDGGHLHFIRFVDEKSDEIYLGYEIKMIEDGNEAWEGMLYKSPFKFRKISDNDLKITMRDAVFHLNPDGQLFEEVMIPDSDAVLLVEWKLLVEE